MNAEAYKYFISDVVISLVDSIRDLDIVFDNQLGSDKQALGVLH
jgi:hypothetical protein